MSAPDFKVITDLQGWHVELTSSDSWSKYVGRTQTEYAKELDALFGNEPFEPARSRIRRAESLRGTLEENNLIKHSEVGHGTVEFIFTSGHKDALDLKNSDRRYRLTPDEFDSMPLTGFNPWIDATLALVKRFRIWLAGKIAP